MSEPKRNVAASVRARLLNRSRADGADFQFLLQRYASERFLYRLGLSSHRDDFVLKGATLFPLWGGTLYRATRDMDFTAYGDSAVERVRAALVQVGSIAVDDGIAFDMAATALEPILADMEYDGLRARFPATLDGARIPMQIDIGFGDAIHPGAQDVEYPPLLDGPAPSIRAYPVESVVAEKLHAIYHHGETNSRLKDFYDLYVLAQSLSFEGERLAGAIEATFRRRRTRITSDLPTGLTPRFFANVQRAQQWRAFRTRNSLPGAPEDFSAVGEQLRTFLLRVWTALAGSSQFAGDWGPSTGWKSDT